MPGIILTRFELVNKTPREVREIEECGLHVAQRRIGAAKLMRDIDLATNIGDLKMCMLRIVTMMTDVK